MREREDVVRTYVYRCDTCGEESDPLTGRELDEVQLDHRRRAHGGLRPDGEQVIEPERLRLVDIPREQKVVGAVLLAVIVLSLLFKIT